jgi:hypothetical protein
LQSSFVKIFPKLEERKRGGKKYPNDYIVIIVIIIIKIREVGV